MPKQYTYGSLTLANGVTLPDWFQKAMDSGAIRPLPDDDAQMRWGATGAIVRLATGDVQLRLGDRIIYRSGLLGVEKR